jgi:beta-alanine--pyruvate transaminase
LAVLDIYQGEGLLTRGAALTDHWQEAMHSLRGLRNVIDVRALGLLAGIELAPRPGAVGARGYEVMVDCFNNGLVVRVTGDTLALSPPLIVEPAQIDEMVTILGNALKRVA